MTTTPTTSTASTRTGVRVRLDPTHRPFALRPWPYPGPPPRCVSRAWHAGEGVVPDRPAAEGALIVTLEPGGLLVPVPLCGGCLARVPPAAAR